MLKHLKKIWFSYKERKRRIDETALSELKFRYHAFRILLANNERALDIINDLEMNFKTLMADGAGLIKPIEELLHVTYELVDGLNRIDGFLSESMYGLHRGLSSAIRDLLDRRAFVPGPQPLYLLLRDVAPHQHGLIGGKAASVARLMRNGLPTPDGFVLTLAAGRLFFKENRIEAPILDLLRTARADGGGGKLNEISEKIGAMILAAPLPPDIGKALAEASAYLDGGSQQGLAVRSSAALEDRLEHSFAGQFTSVLNVKGIEALGRAYREVLAGYFSARSLAYRFEHGLPWTDFDMAVLFQPMIPAMAAGVLYTVDPTDRELDRFMISAVPSLGGLAVDGGAPADLYRLSRSSPNLPPQSRIVEKTVREVLATGGGVRTEAVPEEEKHLPVLSADDIRTLAGLGLVIEYLGGGPQDIEWARNADGGFFILQARPLRLPGGNRQYIGAGPIGAILEGGVTSSPGKAPGGGRKLPIP